MILTMHRQESFSLNSTRNRFHDYSARNYFPEIDQKNVNVSRLVTQPEIITLKSTRKRFRKYSASNCCRSYSARNTFPELGKKSVSGVIQQEITPP